MTLDIEGTHLIVIVNSETDCTGVTFDSVSMGSPIYSYNAGRCVYAIENPTHGTGKSVQVSYASSSGTKIAYAFDVSDLDIGLSYLDAGFAAGSGTSRIRYIDTRAGGGSFSVMQLDVGYIAGVGGSGEQTPVSSETYHGGGYVCSESSENIHHWEWGGSATHYIVWVSFGGIPAKGLSWSGF
jgi:hypothetical protein